jgi:hypothetical protein
MAEPEEEFDFDSDDSWYEDAMNALDAPAHNHSIIYSEEEIADLSELDKMIIRYRNTLLENGFEYIDLQNGDYLQEVIGLSGVIHSRLCNFVLAYKKEESYIVIFQLYQPDETIVSPIELATMIYVNKHLGSYQFIEFYQLENELEEDQKSLNGININYELVYKEKPSFEFYKSDNLGLNKKYIEKIEPKNPKVFEFLNEYFIVELEEQSKMEDYFALLKEFE